MAFRKCSTKKFLSLLINGIKAYFFLIMNYNYIWFESILKLYKSAYEVRAHHESTCEATLDILGLYFHESTTIWYCSNMQLVLGLLKYLETLELKRNGSEIIDM